MGRLPTEKGARVLAVDPQQPKRVYAVGEAGLYRSDDAGQSWQSGTQGLPEGEIVALAIDPRQPLRLFALVETGTLYLSQDGATRWRALPAAVGSG